jgi:hypothetical protein
MPQLYLIIAVLSILLGKLKDIFASINLSDEVKAFIKWLLIGLLIYYVYKVITHHVNKQNALGDNNGQLAIELRNAIYSQATSLHVPFFGDYHIGNGDEAAVLAISLRIKDVSQVSAFYKDLYGVDLFEDLAKVLSPEELAQFNQNVSSVKGGNQNTGDIPTTPINIPAPLPPVVKEGVAVYCKANGVNVRRSDDPSKIMYKVNKDSFGEFGKPLGYVGNFVKRRTEKINGKLINFIEVDIPWQKQDLRYGLNGLIAESYVTLTTPK